MNDTNPELTRALSFDSLAEAENLTGRSYKDDDFTTFVGMGLMQEHNKVKDQALIANQDTTYSSDFATQLSIFLDLGFEGVLCDAFDAPGYEGKTWKETYLILWHPDGLFATMESYHENRRNTAKVIYNWRPNDPDGDDWHKFTSSGGPFQGGIWPGDHDAREGIRHNLDNLRANGEFLPVWKQPYFLWLLNYMDCKVEGYDYKAISNERISRLPQHVQDAIGCA